MKIISSKKWEEMEQKFVELQLALNDQLDNNKNYKYQVDLLLKDNKAKDIRIKGLIEQIDELRKKEVKPVKRVRKVKEAENGKEESNTHR